MTLAETLLQKLAECQPVAARRTVTSLDEAKSWSVAAQVDRCDGLSCQLWELTVRRSALPAARLGLAQLAPFLASKVTGLLEPLAVYEIDEARNEALLRSQEPHSRGDRRTYYELFLRGTDQVVVRRFQATTQSAGPREQVSFTLTFEGLSKLVNDLTSA